VVRTPPTKTPPFLIYLKTKLPQKEHPQADTKHLMTLKLRRNLKILKK
jgi:hypothetical protein